MDIKGTTTSNTTTTTTTTNTTDQTHDFMNVDSFSQLPFIRPAPSTKSTSAAATAIRLFGIDVASSSTGATATENSDSGESTTNTTTTAATNHHTDPKETTAAAANGSGESGRKFECHYCCRNFPTSQALGGHQNAHKRERQHAKRAHLQSAMLAADPHHHHHHLYSLVNYSHRQSNPFYPHSSYTTNINRYNNNHSTNSYNVTTNTTTISPSNHQTHHHQPPTINGSPLAVWRIPTSNHHHHGGFLHRDRSLPLLNSGSSTASVSATTTTTTTTKNNIVGFEHNDQFKGRATSDPHVSLDLHL